jgi:type IV secretory pathway ATPase VirB11/archaellum biosynthesis ATPase
MNGNMIKKMTEIVYKDKVYTIEDTYTLRIPEN